MRCDIRGKCYTRHIFQPLGPPLRLAIRIPSTFGRLYMFLSTNHLQTECRRVCDHQYSSGNQIRSPYRGKERWFPVTSMDPGLGAKHLAQLSKTTTASDHFKEIVIWYSYSQGEHVDYRSWTCPRYSYCTSDPETHHRNGLRFRTMGFSTAACVQFQCPHLSTQSEGWMVFKHPKTDICPSV